MNIYCDKSGYTGRESAVKVQPYAAYSAINFTLKELDDIKQYIYSNYNVQSNEIKGELLVNNSEGQKVIKYIFERYAKNIKLVYHDKKYALSMKIVEYGIEPYLSSNHIYYESNLNNFIARELYLLFITKPVTAEHLFKDFLLIVRGKIKKNDSLLGAYSRQNPLLDSLLNIITTQPSIVWEEIRTNRAVDKWILDVTTTSLLGLLSEWSKTGAELNVIRDNSKVLANNPQPDIIENCGETDVPGTTPDSKLKREICNKDSIKDTGMQIADLFSSTLLYCLNNESNEFSKFIMNIINKDCLCKPNSFCMLPGTSGMEDEFNENKEFYLTQMDMIRMDIKNRFRQTSHTLTLAQVYDHAQTIK